MRREGLNIISKHYVTLTEALLGCSVTINTIAGLQNISMKCIPNSRYQHILSGKGVNGQGDHIAEFEIIMPQNLDPEIIDLFKMLANTENQRLNTYDPAAKAYETT